jgi:hypothetical protein
VKVGDHVRVQLLRPFNGVITELVWESPLGERDSTFAVVELGTSVIHKVKGENLLIGIRAVDELAKDILRKAGYEL